MPQEIRGLARREPRFARGWSRLDEHGEVQNVFELWSRRVRAVQQHEWFRGTLGRGPLQRIGPIAARASEEVEGMPTRYTTCPQWLDRLALQPLPVYRICRALLWRAALPFLVRHVSGKEVIASHDDGAGGLSDPLGHGALARTAPPVNRHNETRRVDRAGTNRGDYRVDGQEP